MALVNGGFLHYMDIKKFLKNLLRIRWSDFEIISQECSLGDPFQSLVAKFLSVHKYTLVNWGFLHYMDMKKFLRNSPATKGSNVDLQYIENVLCDIGR